MIIRNNLASAPLRNYTLYFIGCIVLAGIAVSFAVWNGMALVQWKSENDSLKTKIEQQRFQAAELQRQTNDTQRKINAIKTPDFVNETEFFNNAIKRRVFSWTELLDEFEQLLPRDVRMISVFPSIQGEIISIRLDVSARSLNDIVELITVFQKSPNFSNVTFRSERDQEDGMVGASVSMDYFPGGIKPSFTKTRRAGNARTAPPPASKQPLSADESLEGELRK